MTLLKLSRTERAKDEKFPLPRSLRLISCKIQVIASDTVALLTKSQKGQMDPRESTRPKSPQFSNYPTCSTVR